VHRTVAEFHEGQGGLNGFLHSAEENRDAILLTHGAGANSKSSLLVGMAEAFAAIGYAALRFDLPFRQERPHGPPSFGSAQRDREGIRLAIAAMSKKVSGRIYVGGHSYGGRQATLLLAEEPQLADGLLLLSYPLHPPRRPQKLRTAHFLELRTPVFFAHGTRDPFGSIEEMRAAVEGIPARHELFQIENAGHDLLGKDRAGEIVTRIARAFQEFILLDCE
jgi:predicted alpha/beta-hydrolase family hydrolase